MSNKNALKFGAVALGAGGGKIGDSIYNLVDGKLPIMAVNSSEQDLDSLENIPDSNKVHCGISSGGGAGKNIKIGMESILRPDLYENLKRKFVKIMKGVDFVFLLVSMGGGTGTGELIAMLQKLSNDIKIDHGVICTFPRDNEASIMHENSYYGLRELVNFHQKSKKLKPNFLVSNEELISIIDQQYGELPNKEKWDIANKKIYRPLNELYKYSHKSSRDTIDPQDFKNSLLTKGCSLINSGEFKEANTETSLTTYVDDLCNNSIFMSGGIETAQEAVVIIERPPGAKDSKQIDNLRDSLKENIENCHIGLYYNEELEGAEKPVRIFVMLAGMSFPSELVGKLEGNVKQSKEAIREKKKKAKTVEFSIDIKNLMDDYFEEDEQEEEVSFGFFNLDFEEEEKIELVADNDEENTEINFEEEEEEEDKLKKKGGFFNLG